LEVFIRIHSLGEAVTAATTDHDITSDITHPVLSGPILRYDCAGVLQLATEQPPTSAIVTFPKHPSANGRVVAAAREIVT
jgi:hypothetical protein